MKLKQQTDKMTIDNSNKSKNNNNKNMRPTTRTIMKNKVKKICLFGTSANPPTGKGGHVGVVEALLQLNAFDEIHIVPVYNHTFHSKRNQLIGYNHRIAMCELAFHDLIKMTTSMNTQNEKKKNDENENNNDCDVSSSATTSKTKTTKVIVSRAEEDSFNRICSILSSSSNKDGGRITEEEKSNLRVGTADLLEMLITQEQQQIGNNGEEKEEDVQVEVHHASTEFSFCLGADTFMDLTDWKWKRSKDVLKLLNGRLVVVNRKQHTQHNQQQQQQEGNSNNNNNNQQQQQQKQEQEQKLMLLLRQRIDYINTSLNGQVILLDVPTLGNVSSSMARSLLSSSSSKNGDTIKNLKNTLPLTVVDYIRKHELYGSI